MEQTRNYGLNKPGGSDYARIDVLNANMDAVDAALKDLEESKAEGAALAAHEADGVKHVSAAERETLTQGFALLSDEVDTHIARTDNPHGVTAKQAGAVPTTRKVNGKALSADVTLAAGDVGAASASHSHTWAAITDKPTSFAPESHTHDDRYYTETEMDSKLSGKLGTSGDGKSTTVTFAEAASRAAPASGETQATLWGKVKKLFTDLKAVAFSGSYSDLSNVPGSFPPSVHKHGAGDINSGTLDAARLPTIAVNKGGTGKTTWSANRLIYPSSSTAFTHLAFPSVAGSVLRQGTSGAPYWTSLQDLVAALGDAGGVRIATGSYIGTGTYGVNNPCSLTFPFVPKLIMLLGYVRADGSYSPSLGASSGGYCVHLINVDKLTTAYQTGLGLANYSGLEAYGKKSSDGKTFSWYYSTTSSSNGPNYQCNISGLTYHYAILG